MPRARKRLYVLQNNAMTKTKHIIVILAFAESKKKVTELSKVLVGKLGLTGKIPLSPRYTLFEKPSSFESPHGKSRIISYTYCLLGR
ncbi:MAG: hypothetical protein PHE24_03645 [Patescibacteria group bacterium]|nr:hypothetical protein [Patescibacteria group bacterium]